MIVPTPDMFHHPFHELVNSQICAAEILIIAADSYNSFVKRATVGRLSPYHVLMPRLLMNLVLKPDSQKLTTSPARIGLNCRGSNSRTDPPPKSAIASFCQCANGMPNGVNITRR